MQGVLHLLEISSSTFELRQVEWGTSLHPHMHRGCKSVDADADAGGVALPLHVGFRADTKATCVYKRLNYMFKLLHFEFCNVMFVATKGHMILRSFVVVTWMRDTIEWCSM
jgi:hypothetical protein